MRPDSRPAQPADYQVAHVLDALAKDPRTGELELDVTVTEAGVVVTGTVASPERQQAVTAVIREVLPAREVHNQTTVAVAAPGDGGVARAALVRLAAVGDVHFGTDSGGTLRPYLERLPDQADLLLVAGDLTKRGTPEEARVLARELDGLGLPVVAVLGNHDYHTDQEAAVTAILEAVGVRVLEGASVALDVRGTTVGVAGTKGFGGGFVGACGSDFGEPEMKAFVRHTRSLAEGLEASLRALDTDVRVALLHFSPIEATLAGERLEIYPFLGSYLLAEAIDRAGSDLVLHGHAHRGARTGATPGGVPVRNVAGPVIRQPYQLLELCDGTWLDREPAGP